MYSLTIKSVNYKTIFLVKIMDFLYFFYSVLLFDIWPHSNSVNLENIKRFQQKQNYLRRLLFNETNLRIVQSDYKVYNETIIDVLLNSNWAIYSIDSCIKMFNGYNFNNIIINIISEKQFKNFVMLLDEMKAKEVIDSYETNKE